MHQLYIAFFAFRRLIDIDKYTSTTWTPPPPMRRQCGASAAPAGLPSATRCSRIAAAGRLA